MKSLNPSPESCRRSGVMGLGLIPGHGPANVSIRVTHGHNQYEVGVPSNSSFGYLKSIISQSLGLKPETCKLFFGGTEKQDDETLQIAGVQNNSEVLLVEDMPCGQQVPEEVPETPVASKGEDAVAAVREEVDKLEQQVSALQAVIDSGRQLDNKEIVYLTEMLMRQLLKLDGIEAEGEGRLRRKTEVRRIQMIVETLDTLKSRNSNSSRSTSKNVSSEPLPSSPPHVVTSSSPSPAPPVLPSSSLAPSPQPPSALPVMPSSSTYPEPYHTPPNMPQPTYSAVPHFPQSTHPSSNFAGYPYPAAYPMPYLNPAFRHPYQYYDPSQMSYFTPYPVPSPAPAPAPAPYQDGSSYMHNPSNPFSMPSTKVTQNWEHFG